MSVDTAALSGQPGTPAVASASAIDFETTKEVGYYALVWRRFRSRKVALVAIAVIVFIVAACFIVPLFLPANVPDSSNAYAGLSAQHPFGTDEIGRDLFTRDLLGGQISLEVGLFAMILTILIATALGALSGFVSGFVDGLVTLLTNALLGIPGIVLLILVSKILVASGVSPVTGVILGIGFISWPATSRIIRSVVLSLREKEFVEAARALGTTRMRTILRHIIPNALGPIIVSATFAVVGAILLESALSFLGLGIGIPTATWGALLEGGYTATTAHNDFLYALWPGLSILITVLCFSYVGDALRDAFDPPVIRALMPEVAADQPQSLRVIAGIASVQGGLTVVAGLALVVTGFAGNGGGGATFAGLVAAAAGVLLPLAARGVPALSSPSRRWLLILEWIVLTAALIVALAATLLALVEAALAAVVIVSLQFRSSLAGAFAVGFVGDHPPDNLLVLPRIAARSELVAGQALLSVEGLRTHFFTNDGIVKAVDGISFTVQPGQTVGIVGESGCGKSMTSLSIMRLLSKPGRTVAGRIVFMGRNLLELSDDEMEDVRGNDIAMIFQEPMTALNPVLKVGDQIRDSLTRHFGISDRQARVRIVELFEKVRIPSPKQRVQDYPHQLSGGMRQRVMIAMALACNPRLLIADEPTTALDVTIQAQILALLDELKRTENMGIIMITHDLGVIAEMADRVSVMYAGKIVEAASVFDVFAQPKHPYTQGLLASMPSREKIGKRLNAIQGVVPHPLNLPPGCSFAPRCPHRFDMCDTAFPALDSVGPDHQAACYLYTRKQDEVRGDAEVTIDPTSPLAEELTG